MKKNFIYSFCLTLLMAFISLSAWAQQTVQGTVVDEAGEPVIGASVIVKGTTIGTTTNVDGAFQLAVPQGGELQISFIGYITETFADMAAAKNVVLREDKQQIEEVVVVGYGVQKKAHLTGSVAAVPMDEIADISTGNLGSALKGLMNGVSVSGGDSRPGGESTIYIRNSDQTIASNKTTPLYVIDGFILDASAFNNLDPSSIESISVLKDASAAVYGSRAAGGVILVTTKKGKLGAPKISYSGTIGITDAISTPKMLNAYQYGRMWNAVRWADPTETDRNATYDLYQKDELEAMKHLNYNLLDKYWKTAVTQQHSINLSGATEAASYFANISYYTQDGNLGKLNYDRWNFRAGVDLKITQYLKASLQVSGDYGKKNQPLIKVGGSESNERDYMALLTHPMYIPEMVDGRYVAAYGVSNEEVNGSTQHYNYAYLQQSSDYKRNMTTNTYINGALEYNFGWSRILKGLNLRLSYSKAISTTKDNSFGTQYNLYQLAERSGSGRHLYTPVPGSEQYYEDVILAPNNWLLASGSSITNAATPGGVITRDFSRSDNYQMNFTASYARDFGKHSGSALFSIEKTESEYEDSHVEGLNPYPFSNGQSNSLVVDPTTNQIQTSGTFARSESGTLSYVGRINYAYDDKYLLEFLLRSDASTKFAPENYWGYFPSLSAGWVISKEDWFKSKWTDFLKLRASFGLTGRDNIAAWQWMQTFGARGDKGGVIGQNGAAGNQIEAGSAVNRNVKWDKSYKANVGIDWNILNNRLGFSFEGYYTWDRDMLLKYKGSVPTTVGASSADLNYGKMNSYGVEFSATWRDRIGKDFKYRIQLNTGYSDNKVLLTEWPTDNLYRSIYKGHRTDMGTWGMQAMGIFKSFQEIEEYFEKYNITSYMGMQKDAVRPGMLIYKDIRSAKQADGSYLGPDGIINQDDDQVRLSNRSNPYNFTLHLNGEWKGLSITAQIRASWGGYAFLPSTALMPNDGTHSASSASGWKQLEYTNMPSFWSVENMFVYEDIYDGAGNLVVEQNLNGHYPNLRYAHVNGVQSSYWRVSGARVTLDRLTLAYTLPQKWTSKIGISNVRVNVTGQNLFSFYNPYPKHFMDPMAASYGSYPSLRKFTIGLNVTF